MKLYHHHMHMQLFQTDVDVRWNLILNTIMASWRKCLIRTYWRTRKQSSSFSEEGLNDAGILLQNKWTGFWWGIAGQAIGTFSLTPWDMRKIPKVDAMVQSFYGKKEHRHCYIRLYEGSVVVLDRYYCDVKIMNSEIKHIFQILLLGFCLFLSRTHKNTRTTLLNYMPLKSCKMV